MGAGGAKPPSSAFVCDSAACGGKRGSPWSVYLCFSAQLQQPRTSALHLFCLKLHCVVGRVEALLGRSHSPPQVERGDVVSGWRERGVAGEGVRR